MYIHNKRVRNYNKGQGIVGEIPGHARSIIHCTAKFVQKTNGKQKALYVSLLYF